jgi:hypothetical protein
VNKRHSSLKTYQMKSDNLTQNLSNTSFEKKSENQFPWRVSTSKAIPLVFRPQPSKSIFVIFGSRNFLFRIVCKNVRHSNERIKDFIKSIAKSREHKGLRSISVKINLQSSSDVGKVEKAQFQCKRISTTYQSVERKTRDNYGTEGLFYER